MRLIIPFLFLFLAGCQSEQYVFRSTPIEGARVSVSDAMYTIKYVANLSSEIIKNQAIEKFGFIDYTVASDSEKISHLRKVNQSVHSRFIYTKDKGNQLPSWNSGVSLILQDKKFKGDCEDLALTVSELLILTGFPKESLYKILTISGTYNKQPNHMIGGYMDSNGEMWIFGDTFESRIRKLKHAGHHHTVYEYSRFDWILQYNPVEYTQVN